MPITTVKTMGAGQAGMGLALLAAAGSEYMRAASPLPEDAQRVFDGAINRVGRQRMALVGALIDAGLVYALPNWYSILHLYTQMLDDTGEAYESMELDERFKTEYADLENLAIPIYATWGAVKFGHRLLAVANRNSYPIETSHVENETRKVNETITRQALYGIKGKNALMDGFRAPGILSSPLHEVEFLDNEAWTVSTHSGEDIIADIEEMRAAQIALNIYEPSLLVIPTSFDLKLGQDYKAQSDLTIRQRINELGYVSRIVVEDYMPANTVAMIPLNSSYIDVVLGQGPQRVDWQDSTHPYAPVNHMVVSCEIVRVKQDANDRNGIIIGTPT
jgi:hypothetical protein